MIQLALDGNFPNAINPLNFLNENINYNLSMDFSNSICTRKFFKKGSAKFRLFNFTTVSLATVTLSRTWYCVHFKDLVQLFLKTDEKTWKNTVFVFSSVFIFIGDLNLLFFPKTGNSIRARHELLAGAIGTFQEEDDAYSMVKTLSWILPTAVILSAMLDALLVWIYMKLAHPWKDILFGQEEDKEIL